MYNLMLWINRHILWRDDPVGSSSIAYWQMVLITPQMWWPFRYIYIKRQRRLDEASWEDATHRKNI